MSLKTENVAQSMVQMFCGADGPMSPNGKQQLRIGNICESVPHAPFILSPMGYGFSPCPSLTMSLALSLVL